MHWTLQGSLWLLGFLLELTLAIVIFRRRLHKKYPLFSTYVVMELLRAIVLAAIGRHHPPYFYGYWISECLVALFGFAVVAEIFSKAFEKRLGLQKLGAALFRYSLLLLIVTAVLVAVAAPGHDSDKLIAGILVLKRTQSFVRVGLVGCLFVFVFLLGLPWGNYSIGIAIGFALYGAVESATMLARSYYGAAVNDIWIWSIVTVAPCQRLIWLIYFVRRPSFPPSALAHKEDYSSPRVTTEVSKMNEVLESLLER